MITQIGIQDNPITKVAKKTASRFIQTLAKVGMTHGMTFHVIRREITFARNNQLEVRKITEYLNYLMHQNNFRYKDSQ